MTPSSPNSEKKADALEGSRLGRIERAIDDLAVQAEKTGRWMRFMPLMAAAQLIVGAPAFIISIVVAWATFVQADATKKIQEASAWPYLEISTGFDNGATPPLVRVAVRNSGVGPALIGGHKVTLDGAAFNDWPSIALAASNGEWDGGMNTTTLPAVLQPGEEITAVSIWGDQMRAAFARVLRDGRLGGEICYCNVFGSCWRIAAVDDEDAPTSVAMCQDPYGEDQFRLRQPEFYEPSTYGEADGATGQDDTDEDALLPAEDTLEDR